MSIQSASVQKEIARCSKCGKCRSVCPVFIETKTEGMVARGRISLAEALLAGEIKDSAKMREYLWGCLKCLRCADGCPAAVEFGAIISEARKLLGRRVGLPWSARVMMRLVVTRRWVFDMAVRMTAALQKLLPRRAEGKVRHLPLLFGDGRNLPEIAGKSVLNSFDEYYGPADAERKVALFVGCLINYAYPEVARATIRVLNATGAGVYVPRGQTCCGTPAASLGDMELFERLAKANAKAFSGLPVEAVIVGCASGGATLKKEYVAGSLGAPVVDFGEYVARHADRIKGHFAGRLVWHDPCHLKFVQKITAEPRELLSQVGDFVKSEGEDYCCGMGGVFSAFFPNLSARIAERKTEAVANSGGDVLVTGCAGCMMQLRDRLAAGGSEVRVMHIAEVLAEAIEAKQGGQIAGRATSVRVSP
jgi:glycolate oxidase iron-sulfur subunit